MTNTDFELLKANKDPFEYHKIGNYLYRAGAYGLSKHNKKTLCQISHCNDFRNKEFQQVKNELNNPLK